MEEKEKSCMDCKWSIYCYSFGEYKCLVKELRIYEPENEAIGCPDFKKERKNDEAPKCRCKTCLSRSGEEK